MAVQGFTRFKMWVEKLVELLVLVVLCTQHDVSQWFILRLVMTYLNRVLAEQWFTRFKMWVEKLVELLVLVVLCTQQGVSQWFSLQLVMTYLN